MHIIFQIAAILCSQCQLPIRKRTGTTPAAHNIHALFTAIPMRILVQFQSMMNIMSFFKNQNGSTGIGKLQCCKDSGRAGADNYYIIIIHAKTTLYTQKKRLPYAGALRYPVQVSLPIILKNRDPGQQESCQILKMRSSLQTEKVSSSLSRGGYCIQRFLKGINIEYNPCFYFFFP